MTENASPEADDLEATPSHLELVLRYRWAIVALVAVLSIPAYLLLDGATVPRWAKIAGLGAVVSVPLGAPALAKIVDWLYNPAYVYLVDLDPSGNDEFAVWELPPARWRELAVDGGQLHRLPSKATAYEVQSYDPEMNAAKGTWRGSATDSQLLGFEYKVDQVRGELEEAAQEGRVLKITRSGRIRSALDRILQAFVQSFEEEGIYSGEEVQRATERALRDAGLEPRSVPATDEVGDDGSVTAENTAAIEFVFPNDGAADSEAADAD